MKYFISLILIGMGVGLMAQTNSTTIEGNISYLTSQNVYVRFASTEGLMVGDTLFISEDDSQVPALVVTSLSSISAVCSAIGDVKLELGDRLNTRPQVATIEEVEPVKVEEPEVAIPVEAEIVDEEVVQQTRQKISGRLGLSSYLNFSDSPGGNSQRMRYTFSMNARNISDSKLSVEAYLSFVHRSGEWNEIKDDIFNGLKIYNLAMNYKFSDKYQLWFGRKINPKLSSVGAIDGLQYEMKFNAFTIGLIAGSRPDYVNYSYNFNLLEFGGYVAHEYTSDHGNMQSTLAIINQQNSGATDRRFAYLQHANALIKNVYFFGSAEIDLYKKVNDVTSNTFNLSNLYLSLRYKIIKPLTVSLSYSNRQNVVYYETYDRDFIERLLDTDGTQGYLFQVNYRAGRSIYMGVKTGYRFRNQDPRPTKNLYAYVTMSRVPAVDASVTVSATLLETAYLSGKIFSIGLNKELVPAKLDGGLGYRLVQYDFINSESALTQNMGELNLTYRIMKKLYCSLNVEATFEKEYNYQRVYINITQRF